MYRVNTEGFMPSRIEKRVMEIAAPFAAELGYELVDVEYQPKKGMDSELVIYIDKEGGVTLDDCEALSRMMDAPLDEEDPIPDSYVLCVSSPGIDRPLKTDRDFEKALGSEVDIKLYMKLDGSKEFTGELERYDGDSVTVGIGGKAMTLDRKNIALIRPHISF